MKKIIYSALLALTAAGCLTSCEDMLDTSSEGYVFDKDHTLASANDSLYSAIGILTQLQALGERYVLFGELRGDLVEVSTSAPVDLQSLSRFEPLSEGGAVIGARRDYYSVINNCNVALDRMDVSITEHGVQVMLPEYAAIRTLRDWTLMQLALTYGSASFTEEPILDVEHAEQTAPAVGLDQLVGKLIADLEPYADVKTPNYGSIDGQASNRFFIRPALLLADLYLYNGNYAQAAEMYYKVMREDGYTVSYENANTWTTSVRTESVVSHINTYSQEVVANIPYASDAKKYHPDLVNLTYNAKASILPAAWFVNDMNAAQHYHIDRQGITNISGYLEGDLRGMLTDREGKSTASAFGPVTADGVNGETMITKYASNGTLYSAVGNPENPLMEEGAILTRSVALYRIPHLYLRYAEAANRAGKPSLAFAVLKYGLRKEIVEDETKVDPDELADNLEWTNFTEPMFDANYGTAMRGRGLGIAVEAADYVLPAEATQTERIEWVEERILEELASETCFEGNRFFDLLRISRHRADHPTFMARKVARRFDNPAEIEARLADVSHLWVR
ncbi:MAG: RagB/SusD family nutrient uptake outer membrane protein [Duncaniella sp.]|nr:RagB/SusD family nutrient uptake outer membrane protein [Duncaniella sp.]